MVLRCDFVNRWIELAVKTGTTELTRTGNIYELKLAEITVPKMVTEPMVTGNSVLISDGVPHGLCRKKLP